MTEEKQADNEGLVIKQNMSSYNLKQTSKGNYYWDIKVYSEDIEDAKNKITEMDNWFKENYGGINETSWKDD